MQNSIKCPYCNYSHPVPEVAYANAEFYGCQTFNVCCINCGGAIRASITRTVYCYAISATDFEIDDWGQSPKKTMKSKIINNGE